MFGRTGAENTVFLSLPPLTDGRAPAFPSYVVPPSRLTAAWWWWRMPTVGR